MKSAEEILKEYINFEDVNQSQTVELLPLTIVDAMEEYAIQCQEDMADKKYTEEDMIDAIIYGSSLTTSNVKLYAHNYINSLNKQDNDK